MTQKELATLKKIPKKYREHIVELTIERSGEYNERGQELNNYTVTWDNDDEHTFQSISYMIFAIKEYSIDGYYYSA